MKPAHTRRPILTVLALASVAALLSAAFAGGRLAGCGAPDDPAPVVVPSEAHLAGVPPLDRPRQAGARLDGATSAGAERLEAARTVALYCRLVHAGQFARAGELCGSTRLWSRRALGPVRRFVFRSARVYAAPDARTIVLKAHVRVRAGRGCPLPNGPTVLFFTLGRAGSAAGGWRITAVSTDPSPSRKGSV